MPASLEAAAIFAVLIVPGLEFVAGYRRARVHALPRRDLYVLAQALAVSLAWLPIVWLLGGEVILGWIEDETIVHHQAAVLGLILLNLIVPLAGGLGAGKAVDWLGGHPDSRASKLIAWTGIFKPPSSWDAAWLRASLGEWAAVEIQLQDGTRLGGLFDQDSAIDLSPRPTRDVFFDTEYRVAPDGSVEVEDNQGLWLSGSEIVAVRFAYIELADAAEQEGDG